MKKRNCIFTGKEANSKLTITTDNHNWAKNVPCNKEYLASRNSEQLNELEIRLVELFYQQELARTRVEYYDTQMAEIRSLMSKKIHIEPLKKPEIYEDVELTQEDIDWLNAPMGPIEEKTTPAEEMTQNFKEAAVKSGIADKLYNKNLVKGENHIKEPEEEYKPEECPNPECPSMMEYAPGIGPFCPNKGCDVGDGSNVWGKEDEKLTEEKKDAKVEKKVVKKKLSNIWD